MHNHHNNEEQASSVEVTGFLEILNRFMDDTYLFRGTYIGTQSLEGISHGLVFGHVDESSSQAEMREDEKHLLQDPVHLVQMLERKTSSRNHG